MADTDSTTHGMSMENWREVCDELSSAAAVAQFVQGITLRVPRDQELLLQPGELTGLYHVMQDLIERIKHASALLGNGLDLETETAP